MNMNFPLEKLEISRISGGISTLAHTFDGKLINLIIKLFITGNQIITAYIISQELLILKSVSAQTEVALMRYTFSCFLNNKQTKISYKMINYFDNE